MGVADYTSPYHRQFLYSEPFTGIDIQLEKVQRNFQDILGLQEKKGESMHDQDANYFNIGTMVNPAPDSAPLRIGIIGPSGVGKSSVAIYLRDHYGYEIIQLAGPIKDFVSVVSGISLEAINYGPRYRMFREAMQKVGTAIRDVDEDGFIRHLLREVEGTQPLQRWVVPDIRYPNEAELLRRAGFQLWRLRREGYEGLTGSAGAHSSETSHDAIVPDKVITGVSLKHLIQQVEDTLWDR